MNLLAQSSVKEYMRTYVERDFFKNLDNEDWVRHEMGCKHIGKMDKGILWDGKWAKYKIEDKTEIENLVCLEGGKDHWTTKNLIKFPKTGLHPIL